MFWFYFVALALLSGGIFLLMLGSVIKQADTRSKALLIAVAIVVPVVGLLIYQQRGSSDEVALVDTMHSLGKQADTGSMQSAMRFQRQLEEITQRKPQKAEYWFLLGNLSMELQNYRDALDAFKQASNLHPEDTSLYSRLAEAQFLADDYVLTEAVREHIDRVLESNPEDITVLGILGVSAYRAEQYQAAIRFWQRLLRALPVGSPMAESIQASIAQARVAGDLPEPEAAPADGIEFQVLVSLAEYITADPDSTLFVFARQFDGPPMPVVVERLSVGQLPLQLRMDDSKVMIPGRKLADFNQLELVARLSYSGSPTAQKGDYQVVVGPLNPVEINAPIELHITDLVD